MQWDEKNRKRLNAAKVRGKTARSKRA
jgi:hypothetical protein